MAAECPRRSSESLRSDVIREAVSATPETAAPSLHLLDLPAELLLKVLRDVPRSVRATCRIFRALLDGGQKTLSLRPTLQRSDRRLHHLTALLHRLPSLTSLGVDSFEFRPLAFLTACPALESLTVVNALHCSDEALSRLLAWLRLHPSHVTGCGLLLSIQALPPLTALRSLDLGNCCAVSCVAPLVSCPNLTSLSLGRSVTSLGPLAALTALSSLVCHGGRFTNDVGHFTDAAAGPAVPCAASLTLLHFRKTPIADLTPLSRHSRLTSLVADNACSVTTLAPLALLGGALTHLHLAGCRVPDIAPLSCCTALTSLVLDVLRGPTEVAPLSSCTALTTLALLHMNITSLAPLSSLAGTLTSLDLSNCFSVVDVSPLALCTALHRLDLSSTGVTSVAPLAACARLRTLGLLNSRVPREQSASGCGGGSQLLRCTWTLSGGPPRDGLREHTELYAARGRGQVLCATRPSRVSH